MRDEQLPSYLELATMTTVRVPFIFETNIAPETLGLENEFSFWEGLPVGAMLVS